VRRFQLLLLAGLGLLVALQVFAGTRDLIEAVRYYGIALDEYEHHYETLPPTPKGSGYIREGFEPGEKVHLRFALPHQQPRYYALNLDNFVALSGRGHKYRFTIRVHSPQGEVVSDKAWVGSGDNFNAQDYSHVEVTRFIKPQDLAQGYLDVFVSSEVEGDKITLYRDDDAGRDMYGVAITDLPGLEAQLDRRKRELEEHTLVIPEPKELHWTGEGMPLAGLKVVLGPKADEGDAFAASELVGAVKERGLQARVTTWRRGEALPDRSVVLALAGRDQRLIEYALAGLPSEVGVELPDSSQGYWLAVTPHLTLAIARRPEGVLYAAETLRQLAQRPEASLPGVTIRDWPDFKYRMVQYDLARMQTINLEFMKRFIAELGRCKINMLMIYMEDDYKFKAFPFLGRKGTLDAEKAKAIVAFANKYQMQVVPQFESLGHAAGVLRHPELAELRENGKAWDFCTSNPKTWDFLNEVYKELTQVFWNTSYLHVGGDEFEGDFGKCPKCKAYADEHGLGALYTLHMQKLNKLCARYNRRMMFWTGHSRFGQGEKEITIQYSAGLPTGSIPFEWIYHAPSSYPSLEQLQQSGFRRIYACPSVVEYSRIYPDYPLTFRSIETFYRAAKARNLTGVCCTTWELMRGGLYENSWYGMIYSAEAAWNTATPAGDYFDKKYAQVWFGTVAPAAGSLVHQALYLAGQVGAPWPWNSSRTVSQLVLNSTASLGATGRRALKTAKQGQRALLAALEQANRLDYLARRHHVSLHFLREALRLHLVAAERLLLLQQANRHYSKALASSGKIRKRALLEAVRCASEIADKYAVLAREYQVAVERMGACANDAALLRERQAEYKKLGNELSALAEQAEAPLPLEPAPGFWILTAQEIARWEPNTLASDHFNVVQVEVSRYFKEPGRYHVSFDYQRGSAGLAIAKVELWSGNRLVAKDEHPGFSGYARRDTDYVLKVKAVQPGQKYLLKLFIRPDGGSDSAGAVILVVPGHS